MTERVQKIMARAGYGSRRSCEAIIQEGRVRVNGKIIHLGDKADSHQDKIEVDGKELAKEEAPLYIMLHKPRGVLSDVNPQDSRPTVREMVPETGHLFAVGRLDMDSEGLILLTNDGELANKLTHPRYGHEKEYRVLVSNKPDNEQLATWRRGVVLSDGHKTAPAFVSVEKSTGKGAWLRVVLREGHKRVIREVGKSIGLPVQRILRTRINTLELGDLKSGAWRHLTKPEIRALKNVKQTSKPSSRSRRKTR